MRPEIDDELESLIAEAVDSGPYMSKGEFVRDACRRRLEALRDGEEVTES